MNLLRLGVSEHLVRQISGHAPGSNEFHWYVAYSQSHLEQEVDKAFRKFENGEFTAQKVS